MITTEMIKNIFSKAFDEMTTTSISNVAKIAFSRIHPLFWHEAASSSGKYHPEYALGDGGLARHTYAAYRILLDMLPLNMFNIEAEYEKEACIAAIILHDSCKRGMDFSSENTCFEHPILVRNLISTEEFEKLSEDEKKAWNLICEIISSHMGQWNTSKYSDSILPLPNEGEHQNLKELVHLADYLASRKDILLYDLQ